MLIRDAIEWLIRWLLSEVRTRILRVGVTLDIIEYQLVLLRHAPLVN